MQEKQQDSAVRQFDAIVVGAGFGGVYAVYKFRQMGMSVRVLEAGDGVGGTWYHNRYPGARCDIESLDYSFSFSNELQQEWNWSERYASQPEILAYINHVVDRFDLAKDIQLNTRVTGATFNEESNRWLITTEQGETFSAKYAVMATGVLSVHQVPNMKGLETFEKQWFHTGDWPKEGVDVSGKRVGVIGTGSSATQLIPIVAQDAQHLYVFQRTPNYTMPAQNHPMKPDVEKEWKATYPERRKFARQSGFGHNQVSNHQSGKEVSNEERRAELERRWDLGGLYMMRAFKDILTDPEVNHEAAEFVRNKIRSIVKDPETAEALCPPGELYIGTKRLCSGTQYYETFNRDNVSLVNVRKNAIDRITPKGVLLQDGTEYELDMIIFATGFDAMTGAMNRINPVGRNGRRLKDEWAAGPRTYLGMTVNGFPNMFIIAGPGSPSVFSNMVTSIEQHVEWVTDCAKYMEAHNIATIEASVEAQDTWTEHVTEAANRTLYAYSKDTWFYGSNTPGKPVVFMPYVGGVGNYYQRILKVAQDGYEGYTLSPATQSSNKVA
ncbi:NAD(P)/FAD-dependent oxidoreductase [Neopusillimonas maritima]|jgi:cation diffusion facilitator CzcD-associated flavoprotein CzcO|uniref:Cyclohexanone monooxygenase n=1 Tax=Neopusillimonas maritima TaxID=2026239 RepID=A0ABX9MTX9_9BURK|nr:NAD(P)/FAD-dependent oxidoreductase [Neopusillimonas maritima]RII82407.1 cyclohexanone monooxygenase [Neopusillimonas maritima]